MEVNSIFNFTKKNLFDFIKFKSFNIIIFFNLISNIILQEYSRETPINIIFIGEKGLQYSNFISFSNGDIFYQTSGYPANNRRNYYGLKSNGRGYFRNENNEETPFFSLDAPHPEKLESCNSIFIKDGKEYFISMGRKDSYTEIFDHENKSIISYNNAQILIKFYNHNFRPNLIRINTNSYILSVLNILGAYYTPIIIKFDLNLTNLNQLYSSNFNIKENDYGYGGIVSCFQTENNKIIICFYGGLDPGWKYKLIIVSYNITLSELKKEEIKSHNGNFFEFGDYFYSIFFKEDGGFFIYYMKNSIGKKYPFVIFKKYNKIDNKFENYFSNINEIKLNKNIFDTGYLKNDIIKISDNKLGFFTVSENHDIIFIILLNIFKLNNDYNIKVRYYSIAIYNFFHYHFYTDIKAHIYNDFIILGESYCKIEKCEENNVDNAYYSALMFIGYPNGTDYNFDIINYLFMGKNNSIENITFSLMTNFTIENNIFGYIFCGIKIRNISQIGYIYLAYLNSDKILYEDSFLNETEEIKIKFENNTYNESYYKLEYSYNVTEPDYQNFEEYPIEKENFYNDDNEDIFNNEKKIYIGKSIYYEIILSDNLTTNCNNISCSLCFSENLTCITSNPFGNKAILETTYLETNEIETTYLETNEIETTLVTSFISEIKSNIEEDNDKIIIIKEYLDKTKEDLNIKEIINEKEIGKIYDIRGKDFSLKIKPTNASNFDNSTYVDFYECEKILRKSYNISNTSIITFFQLELDNNDEKSFINQVEYLTYDDKKTILNLSLCKNINIQIHHVIKENINLDKEYISSFRDLGIDIFNIQDSFFTDLCNSNYSDLNNSNNDIILEDRIKDIFQNYSLCEQGCNYKNLDVDNMTIICDCKIKDNISTVISPLNLAEEKESSILDSNIGVVKCYNLVFSFKDKLKNIGFWIFLILIIINIILIIFYFSHGIKPILEYIFNEMVKNGYLKKNK